MFMRHPVQELLSTDRMILDLEEQARQAALIQDLEDSSVQVKYYTSFCADTRISSFDKAGPTTHARVSNNCRNSRRMSLEP
jgi:hypothetical protein